VDGGGSWAEAVLGEGVSEFAWHGWSYEWEAHPGEYELCCRATDSEGKTQPLTPEWNYDGFCNNAVQRVRVVVRSPSA
jgi:sulfane dehydrogenase subunit SoxC